MILVSSIPKLIDCGCRFAFTDEHAASITARWSTDVRELDRVDWPLLRSGDFSRDADDPKKLSRYQAEVLVRHALPISALLGIACATTEKQAILREMAQREGVRLMIEHRPTFFFQ